MFAPYAFRSVMLALCAVFVLAVPAAAFDMPAAGAVDAATASELIRSVRPTVLDVRTDGEFAAGHMPGALHIPVADLERRMEDVPGGRILVLCRPGKRAERAWNLLHAARPQQEIWFLTGKPRYGTDGSWRFAD